LGRNAELEGAVPLGYSKRADSGLGKSDTGAHGRQGRPGDLHNDDAKFSSPRAASESVGWKCPEAYVCVKAGEYCTLLAAVQGVGRQRALPMSGWECCGHFMSHDKCMESSIL